jgi:hypothetical protein
MSRRQQGLRGRKVRGNSTLGQRWLVWTALDLVRLLARCTGDEILIRTLVNVVGFNVSLTIVFSAHKVPLISESECHLRGLVS